MKVESQHVDSARYNDSIVYRFKILVDGEPIQTENEVEPGDRIFAVQVQDGHDAAEAIRNTLQAVKTGLEKQDEALPQTPAIEV